MPLSALSLAWLGLRPAYWSATWRLRRRCEDTPNRRARWAATQETGTPWYGRKVVSVSGDGGFGQYAMEFTTAVHYGMDITHVLLRNDNLGKITKEQRAGEWPVWQTSLANPSFAEFANLCGGRGIQVDRSEALDQAIGDALAHDGPALIEVISDTDLM